jgi:hypothetical protein
MDSKSKFRTVFHFVLAYWVIGYEFSWQEDQIGYFILSRDISLTEQQIEEIIDSMEKYE